MSRLRRSSNHTAKPVIWLHGLALLLFISGFLGVLMMPVLGLSKSLPLTLGVHFGILASLIFAGIWKYGSPSQWIAESRAASSYGVHPRWIVLFGLLFLAGGLGIAFAMPPGKGPNAVNLTETRYMGSLFIQWGLGVIFVASGEILHRSARGRKKKRTPVR